MNLLPKRLQPGDTIGIVAPASPPNQESLERSYAFLEKLGLKWKLGRHVKDVNGYLAGTDDDRLADIEAMFADPDIDGILCAGGGYGSARYADRLDYQLIRENPKVFWGFSDITYLHTAIGTYSELVTFHGPMLASCVGKDTFHELSAKLFQQLFEPMELHYTEEIGPLKTVAGGVASGELTGGNLSLLASGIGTKFEVDTKGKILLIEDVGEEPYRVDNLMNQLRLAGKFADAAGIVIGDFAKAEPKKEPSLSLEEVLEFYTGSLGKPVVSGFKIGHCEPHFAVPLGTLSRLDADAKTLTILPGVE
ncbi:putative murein peptide carboxypeptidase [Sporosarcina sp. NCCP-2716]|uniref:S66 peptidase family protein n=1 Tax=Sporosarcina sp. NCCP-2716 TaxID=2943679 RepID=UPI002041B7D6|nr:LD-carboxypeptidase [Sporosarcina sp. NCCP-2716]GKV68504.1 putative murein peptide carboxypeptidase [Sporosarcina sp. NCCP-2716]